MFLLAQHCRTAGLNLQGHLKNERLQSRQKLRELRTPEVVVEEECGGAVEVTSPETRRGVYGIAGKTGKTEVDSLETCGSCAWTKVRGAHLLVLLRS